MNQKSVHIPVMQEQVKEYLNLPADGIFVDCTLGLGGHTNLISTHLGPQGRIICIDKDTSSLQIAKERLGHCAGKCNFVHEDFRNLDKVLEGLNVEEVDGILFDFGISSFQMDNPERGFSLKENGPLDMRMDQESYISADDLVNSLSEQEISTILKKYGEERWHKRIARGIIAKRPIQSTSELCDVVLKSMPSGLKWQRIHPATRTFQAFRIVVNRELEAIEAALEKAIAYLKPGGRICTISFHSLEDRIVKNVFRDYAKNGEIKLIVKKPLVPDEDEIQANPHSRSAKLRIAEKL